MMSIRPKVKRILVIKNRAIGDTVLLSGVLRILKANFPKHQIHVLVRAPAGELLEELPYVDRIISIHEPSKKIDRVAHWMRWIRRLREKKYEYVLNFHASFRTALTATFLRAEKCVANHHELKGRNWFSDFKVPNRGQIKPIIDRDLDILRALGMQVNIAQAMPEIKLNQNERKQALAYFKEYDASRIKIFLGVGASKKTKQVSASAMADLAKRLILKYNAYLVMVTLPSEEKFLKKFYNELPQDLKSSIIHFEKKSLRETAKIISACQFYIGNDSGLKHVAVALHLKTFTYFGPEAPLEWHPYDHDLHPFAFIEKLECRTVQGRHWCSLNDCKEHHNRCLTDLSLQVVWPKIENWINKYK